MNSETPLLLELEKRLETGLGLLGHTLGKRKYHEEIVEGRLIDDSLSGVSSDELIQAFRERDTKKFSEIFKKMTPDQAKGAFHMYIESCLSDSNFMFRRSYENETFSLEYSVRSTEKHGHYESQADRIIQEGLIAGQSISFNAKDSKIKIAIAPSGPPVMHDFSNGLSRAKIEEVFRGANKMNTFTVPHGMSQADAVSRYIFEEIKKLGRGYE